MAFRGVSRDLKRYPGPDLVARFFRAFREFVTEDIRVAALARGGRDDQYVFHFATPFGSRGPFEGTIKAMQGFLDCYDGSKLKGMVCAPGVYEKGAVKDTKYPAAAYQLGLKVK